MAPFEKTDHDPNSPLDLPDNAIAGQQDERPGVAPAGCPCTAHEILADLSNYPPLGPRAVRSASPPSMNGLPHQRPDPHDSGADQPDSRPPVSRSSAPPHLHVDNITPPDPTPKQSGQSILNTKRESVGLEISVDAAKKARLELPGLDETPITEQPPPAPTTVMRSPQPYVPANAVPTPSLVEQTSVPLPGQDGTFGTLVDTRMDGTQQATPIYDALTSNERINEDSLFVPAGESGVKMEEDRAGGPLRAVEQSGFPMTGMRLTPFVDGTQATLHANAPTSHNIDLFAEIQYLKQRTTYLSRKVDEQDATIRELRTGDPPVPWRNSVVKHIMMYVDEEVKNLKAIWRSMRNERNANYEKHKATIEHTVLEVDGLNDRIKQMGVEVREYCEAHEGLHEQIAAMRIEAVRIEADGVGENVKRLGEQVAAGRVAVEEEVKSLELRVERLNKGGARDEALEARIEARMEKEGREVREKMKLIEKEASEAREKMKVMEAKIEELEKNASVLETV